METLIPGSQGRPAIKLSASVSSFDSFTVSERSPEKAGVGGSIPSLATI